MTKYEIDQQPAMQHDSQFSPIMCWTCHYCIYDIEMRAYVCQQSGNIIGGRFESCRPASCSGWTRT